MTPSNLLSESSNQLCILVARFRSDPNYMASALDAYRKQERLSEETIACRLKIEKTQLSRLELCKRPRSDGENFQKDIHQIAKYTGASALEIAQILHEVEVFEVFQNMPNSKSAGTTQAPSYKSVLAAARDKAQEEVNSEKEQEKTSEEDEQSDAAE